MIFSSANCWKKRHTWRLIASLFARLHFTWIFGWEKTLKAQQLLRGRSNNTWHSCGEGARQCVRQTFFCSLKHYIKLFWKQVFFNRMLFTVQSIKLLKTGKLMTQNVTSREGGGQRSPEKVQCRVLFEWPLSNVSRITEFDREAQVTLKCNRNCMLISCNNALAEKTPFSLMSLNPFGLKWSTFVCNL